MAIDSEPFPPPAICSERVLHYAVLDESVGINSGHGLMFIGGKELGRVPFLAICEQEKSSKFWLPYCDGDWESIGVSEHDSVVAAKRLAERIYPGSSAKWVEAHFTDEDVERHLDEIWADSRCSFCGRRPDQGIESIIDAPCGNARICDECVAVFSRK